MAKVAIFCGAYLPGYKAGGPIQSVSRIVEAQPEHEFRIITQDREAGDHVGYPGIAYRKWNKVGVAEVAYLRPGVFDFWWLAQQVRSWKPDVVYLNSLHSPWFALLPELGLRVGALRKARLVVAPRGETSSGALNLKQRKKRAFKPLIKLLLSRQVTWHVSTEMERHDLIQWWGGPLPANHDIRIQVNRAVPPAAEVSHGAPDDEAPRLVFVSRIDRMKGLDRAIRIVADMSYQIQLHVHGTVTDDQYWQECVGLASTLLTEGQFHYLGDFRPEESAAIFSAADLFIFPTRGENFGHVVSEALCVGCPVALTPTTPWNQVIIDGGGLLIDSDDETAAQIDAFLQDHPAVRSERRMEAHNAYVRWFHGVDAVDDIFA